jgi:hypothetical protein
MHRNQQPKIISCLRRFSTSLVSCRWLQVIYNFLTYCIALMRVQVCVTLLGLRVDVLHYNTPCFRPLADGSTSLEKIKIQSWTRDTDNLGIRSKPRGSWEKMG